MASGAVLALTRGIRSLAGLFLVEGANVFGAVLRADRDGWVAAADQDEIHQETRGSSVAVVEGMDIHQAHVRRKGHVGCVAGGDQPTGEIVHQGGNLWR